MRQLLVVVVLAGLLVAAITALVTGERQPEPDGRFVSVALVKGFDPTDSGGVYGAGAQSQVMEGLYEFEYLMRPFKVKPALADGFPEISADGLTYTFRLKKGIVFQDSPCFEDGKGREVTAHDFVYCWKRLMAVPSSTGAWLLDGKIAGLDEWKKRANKKLRSVFDRVNEYYPYEHPDMRPLIEEEVEGLRALDDHTLQVKLTQPFPQFMWVLGMSYTVVYPHEALEHFGMGIQTHPVGTGPYMCEEYWPFSRKILFERNPTFRGDTYPTEGAPGDEEKGLLEDAGKPVPFMDRIELVMVEDSSPRWLQFVEGRLDRVETEKDIWAEAMTADGTLRPDIAEYGIRVHIEPKADLAFTGFNMEDPVIGAPAGERGKKIRQAMSLAYDTPTWLKIMRNGFWATPAFNPLPPTVSGFVDVKSPYSTRNVARAKELLAEAGYPGGKGLPVLHYEMSGASTVNRNGAEIFKASMAEAGIKIELHAQTWDQFLDKVKSKNAQIFGMAWLADYPDAENFLTLFYGPNEAPGANSSNFKNAEYDKLFDQMKVMQPGPERDEVIRKMVEIVNEHCPLSYTDYRIQYSYTNSWLKNFKFNYLTMWPFKYYRIDEAERARRLGPRKGKR